MKKRLDVLCVERGLAPSRQQAQRLILAGKVLADEQPATKAGSSFAEDVTLRLRGAASPYVSRGGVKLAAALVHFERLGELEVTGALALDVGASTGGFTDCLLQHGARHVIAVDVGYGQLAWKLRQDERVSPVERTNARHLDPAALRGRLRDPALWPPALATVDVSFISLTLVLPAIRDCLAPESPILALVKPQFEAGRADVSKGVVRDPEKRRRAIHKVLDWAHQTHYTVVGELDSPIAGPKGNLERWLLLRTPGARLREGTP